MAEERGEVLNLNYDRNERYRKVSFVFWLGLCFLLIGLDQLFKRLAFGSGFGNFLDAFYPVIRKFLFLNYNFVFGLPLPKILMFAFYLLVLVAIVWHVVKNFSRFGVSSKIAWVLVLAGAVSNIAERIVLGYVRDFVYVLSGIFNLADGYIIAGVIILLAQSVKRKA